MILLPADEAGLKILQLLGIEDKCIIEATIYIKANNFITANVTSLVRTDNKIETELETVLKKYKLVEIEEKG